VQSNALGQGLHWGDYAVMAMYLVGTLGLGFIFRRRGADTEDYLLGGRRMPWWLTGVSYVASLLSTVSLVALPGEAFNHGLSVSLASLAEPFCAVATYTASRRPSTPPAPRRCTAWATGCGSQ